VDEGGCLPEPWSAKRVRLAADIDVTFSPDATVTQVDAVTSAIRGRLVDRIPHLDDVGFHVVAAQSPRL